MDMFGGGDDGKRHRFESISCTSIPVDGVVCASLVLITRGLVALCRNAAACAMARVLPLCTRVYILWPPERNPFWQKAIFGSPP